LETEGFKIHKLKRVQVHEHHILNSLTVHGYIMLLDCILIYVFNGRNTTFNNLGHVNKYSDSFRCLSSVWGL